MALRLNLGSGRHPLEGHINCDLQSSAPNEGVDIVLDLRHHLPFATKSCEEVTMLQVLEHLETSFTPPILKQVYRVLEPDGLIDVEVPDIAYICKKWPRASYEERWVGLGVNKNYPPLAQWIWGRGQSSNRHLTGFDRERLERALMKAGFKDIEATKPRQGLSIRLRGRKREREGSTDRPDPSRR